MTIKRMYARPQMRVVELRQHGMLMTSDPQKSAQKQDYESVEWE